MADNENQNNYCACTGEDANYIILLNQQGPQGPQGEKGEQGYSPIANYIINNDTMEFTLVNENNTVTTPNMYDYVAKRDLSNTNLSTTLANYLTSADAATQYLKVDGSNAADVIHLKNIAIDSYTGFGSFQLKGTANDAMIHMPHLSIYSGDSSNTISFNRDLMFSPTFSKLYYGDVPNPKNEVAVKRDIPTVNNSTITITQGGVTKGSFTLNQPYSDTIELNAGVQNPLVIEGEKYTATYSNGDSYTRSNIIQIDVGNNKDEITGIRSGYKYWDSGSAVTIFYTNFLTNENLHIKSNQNKSPLATDITSKDFNITFNYDNATLKVNDNNELYVDSSALGIDLSNYVTLDTEQTISGPKTFNNLTIAGGNNLILNNQDDTNHIWITNDGQVSTTDSTGSETTTTVMNHLTYLATGNGTEVLQDIDNMQLPIALYNSSNSKVANIDSDTNGDLKIDTDNLQVAGSVSTDQLLSNDSVSYLTINTDKVLLGNGALSLDTFGSGTRPTYNNVELALLSDVNSSGGSSGGGGDTSALEERIVALESRVLALETLINGGNANA